MAESIDELAVGHIVGATRLGQSVADVRCTDASVAVAIARSGRFVTIYEASDAARAMIGAQLAEVRERITLAKDSIFGQPPVVPFDAAFARSVVTELDDPSPFFRALRSICRSGAPIFVGERSGASGTNAGALWNFTPRTLGFALEPFGAPDISVAADRRWLCARLGAPSLPPHRARIVCLLRLSAEDRWLRPCLAQLDELAGLIVTIDDNVPEPSFELVRAHPTVAHARRRTPVALTAEDWQRAERLVTAWRPDWTLRLDSSELLAPGAVAEIRRALANIGPEIGHVILPTTMLWDRIDQQRGDAPASYIDRPRLTRGDRRGSGAVRLAIGVRDYAWVDPGLRTARKALALSGGFEQRVRADWRFAPAPHLATVSNSLAVTPTQILLDAALAGIVQPPRRVLCVDPAGSDAARIVGRRWPNSALTAISAASPLSDPYARPYDFVVRGNVLDLDLALFFASREYDIVVDFDPLGTLGSPTARSAKLTTIMQPRGRLLGIVDEATAAVQLDELLATRAFFDAGLRIESIAHAAGECGERISLVAGRLAGPAPDPIGTMTVVVPVGADAPLESHAAYCNALAATCDVPGVRILIARCGGQRGGPESPHFGGALTEVQVHEHGADATIAAAYETAPAAVMCVLELGTRPEPGWCRSTIEALAAGATGIVVLRGEESFDNGAIVDGPVLAVATRAVHPYAWPRRYTDDRARAAVLAGIAARAGFGVGVVPVGYREAPPRRRADPDRLGWETARARRSGFPGDHSALRDITRAPVTLRS